MFSGIKLMICFSEISILIKRGISIAPLKRKCNDSEYMYNKIERDTKIWRNSKSWKITYSEEFETRLTTRGIPEQNANNKISIREVILQCTIRDVNAPKPGQASWSLGPSQAVYDMAGGSAFSTMSVYFL